MVVILCKRDFCPYLSQPYYFYFLLINIIIFCGGGGGGGYVSMTFLWTGPKSLLSINLEPCSL